MKPVETVILEMKDLYNKIKDDPDFEGLAEKAITPIAMMYLAQATANMCNCLSDLNQTLTNIKTRLENRSLFQSGGDGI